MQFTRQDNLATLPNYTASHMRSNESLSLFRACYLRTLSVAKIVQCRERSLDECGVLVE
jgi:hypothetical protein